MVMASRIRYSRANHLVITADGGGSNGSRVRLWKCELQHLLYGGTPWMGNRNGLVVDRLFDASRRARGTDCGAAYD
jgi:hypothetical protein